MENKEKVYVGNGRKFETQYGENFEIELSRDEFEKAWAEAERRGWINSFTRRDGSTDEKIKITLWQSKEPKAWATHYGVLAEPYRKGEGNGSTGNGGDGYRQRQGAPVVERAADVVTAATPEDDNLPF